jgi:hypothetical protein
MVFSPRGRFGCRSGAVPCSDCRAPAQPRNVCSTCRSGLRCGERPGPSVGTFSPEVGECLATIRVFLPCREDGAVRGPREAAAPLELVARLRYPVGSPLPPPQRCATGTTLRALAPTNSWRGRPILYSGSPIISLSCAIQPTVRASAKMAVNRLTGMPNARCTMPL